MALDKAFSVCPVSGVHFLHPGSLRSPVAVCGSCGPQLCVHRPFYSWPRAQLCRVWVPGWTTQIGLGFGLLSDSSSRLGGLKRNHILKFSNRNENIQRILTQHSLLITLSVHEVGTTCQLLF